MTYKPSELRLFLAEIGAAPLKKLSQNFLIDGNIVRKMADLSLVSKGDTVIEIGPGPGALTEELLKRGAHVTAIEKDPLFAKALHRFQTNDKRLTVIEGDALKIDYSELKGKVVANLPYHITSPLLSLLLPNYPQFSTLTLMVQKEVAERILKERSSLTLFVEFYSEPTLGFHVPRTCFYPAPKVTSSVIQLKLKKTPKVSSIPKFFNVVRTSYQHRRKMMRSSLSELYPPDLIEKTLEKIGLSKEARPETLSLNDFLRFFEEID
jgi:16S rRNA (adenine1518-N6/adenine1519-N6)-dimethyltransferase